MDQSNPTSMEEMAFSGEWIRKATTAEVEMEEEHLKCHMLIWYQLDLSSKKPLQGKQVKEALEHLYRKASNLNVCFGTQGGETWLRKATNPNVDFKVHHGVSLAEVRENMRNYRYNSETGPLFCGRLMINSPDPNEGSVDMEPSFSHKSHMIFGFHHAITDGMTNMHIMGLFLSLLNDVIANKPIDSKEPFGTLPSDEETLRLVMETKEQLYKDPTLQQKIADNLKLKEENVVLVDKAFQKFEDKKQIASIIKVLDENTTVNFVQRCRQEKVTVTIAVTAIVNMALVDIAVEEGFINEVYTVTNAHIVNMRRYWKTDAAKPLGNHVDYPLLFFTETPKDVRTNFWNYAKNLANLFKEDVFSGRILANKAYALLSSEKGTNVEESSDTNKRNFCDFISSSMGDITSIVTEGGDHVRITNLSRGSTFHLLPEPALVNFHTFRNIFTIIFDYNKATIESTIAERLVDQIVSNIRELI